MSIVGWEPFRDMLSLREAMDRLFEQSFVSPERREWLAPAQAGLALDVYQTDDSVVVKSSIPGVKLEEVDISIKGNILNISGETEEKEEVEEENYLRRERRYGAFSRSLALPEGIDADKAEAEFEDGILTLTIPKVPEAKPKVIKVKGKAR
jgi:HSP20 family protein